jgi:hypothetical protein
MAANNPQTVKILSLILKLIGALPLLIGLGLLVGAGFYAKHQSTILNKWPTVDAEVVRSDLASHWSQSTHGGNMRVYQALIDFRYTVAGKAYAASAGSDYSTSSRAEMQQKVDTYAPGTHHPIRYNPANPYDIRYDAGLTFGFFLGPFVLAVSGLMACAVGAVFFLFGWAIGGAKVRCSACGQLAPATEAICPNCRAALAPGGAAG